MQLLAKTFQGLEELLAEEIRALGGRQVRPVKRAVQFEGDLRMVYKANLQSALSLRILVFLFEFEFQNQATYYDRLYVFNWEDHLDQGRTFAIDAVVQSKIFPHTRMAVYKAKDAIVDRLRQLKGTRPNVAPSGEDLRIHCYVKGGHARVYLDSSGTSLHQRGYKKRIGRAPINEVLAAGMVRLSGWRAETPFVDPMCGSGTIPIEAALYASHTPVNRLRRFGFMKWLGYDNGLWQAVLEEAEEGIVPLRVPVMGGDRDRSMVEISRENAVRAGMSGEVLFFHRTMEGWSEVPADGHLVFNPPFDQRLKESDIYHFYKGMGDALKQKWSGCTAWMITANREALKHVGLKASRKIPLYNGPLESRFVRYEMYRGSKNPPSD